MIQSTMQRVPLSLNNLLERAGKLYPQSGIVSRLPDKSLVRHRFADFYRRSRALASALVAAGLKKGDRVATLCWNHYAHLECYFGIPAAGGVMHTLNLRLAPGEIAWIANHAQDRFLVVDDLLLPLYDQFKADAPFEQVIVVPLTGAAVPAPALDYEAFLAAAPADFDYAPHAEDDPVAMCYTSGTTGRPKGVVYSHRSTLIHSLMANQPDHWCLSAKDSVDRPARLRADRRSHEGPRQVGRRVDQLGRDGEPADGPRGGAGGRGDRGRGREVGRAALACVVLKQGSRATREELRSHLGSKFANWQLPDRFEFLDSIPRTSTGKFWKVKLRERFR